MEMDDEGNLIVTRPKISGKIKLTYNEDKATEQQMEVDADAYMAELRGQVGVVILLCLHFCCDVVLLSCFFHLSSFFHLRDLYGVCCQYCTVVVNASVSTRKRQSVDKANDFWRDSLAPSGTSHDFDMIDVYTLLPFFSNFRSMAALSRRTMAVPSCMYDE